MWISDGEAFMDEATFRQDETDTCAQRTNACVVRTSFKNRDVNDGKNDRSSSLLEEPINRRTALGAIATVTASAAAVSLSDQTSQARADSGVAHPFRGVFGRMTGAKAAVSALVCEGVRCVFGIPGAQSNEIWDAFKSANLPYLLTTHEGSASVMADAAARVTGEVGVFCIVPGPGITNALTGIGEARLDSVPIVGIITDVKQGPDAPAFQVHSLPTVALLQPVCKAVIPTRHQAEIPAAIHQAFRIARAGEPGPVAVVVPYDFWTKTWDYRVAVPPQILPPFDEHAYGHALALLSNKRKRVGIYAGLGCVNAYDSLARVAEILQAPVATSVSGKGTISDAHPLAVGWGYGAQGTRAAEKAFKDVDLVLAIGVRYSEVSTANYAIPKHDCLIHVDANPDNLGRNVPATVKVTADAAVFLARLQADAQAIARPVDHNLTRRIAQLRSVDREHNGRPIIEGAVDPMFFYSQLRRSLGCEELIFVDVTVSTHWASEAIEVDAPRRYFTPANNQSMGWAIPAAIGAQAARPDRIVVATTGDGCFLMSAIETSTAVRAGLPVKFFVLVDGAYAYMQKLQEPVYRRTTATELARVDYAAFAQAFGLAYNRICQNVDVASGIARALATPGPVLTEVDVSYDGREIRWLNAVKSSYIKHMTTGQGVRAIARISSRSIAVGREND
jgi:acetolactate synthase-1/2/3 large subunit